MLSGAKQFSVDLTHGQTEALGDAAQQEQVADLILGRSDAPEQDLARRIIDGSDQG